MVLFKKIFKKSYTHTIPMFFAEKPHFFLTFYPDLPPFRRDFPGLKPSHRSTWISTSKKFIPSHQMQPLKAKNPDEPKLIRV
jgi:hypothetical protein